MAAIDDVDDLIERYQLALDEFVKGNPEPAKPLWSHGEDVSLANPYSPPVRGWEQVARTMEHAASLRSDDEFVGSEVVAKRVTPELAYVVEVERLEARVYGGEDVTPYALRVTMIFRPKDGVGSASTRRPDNHGSASGISHTGVDLPYTQLTGEDS